MPNCPGASASSVKGRRDRYSDVEKAKGRLVDLHRVCFENLRDDLPSSRIVSPGLASLIRSSHSSRCTEAPSMNCTAVMGRGEMSPNPPPLHTNRRPTAKYNAAYFHSDTACTRSRARGTTPQCVLDVLPQRSSPQPAAESWPGHRVGRRGACLGSGLRGVAPPRSAPRRWPVTQPRGPAEASRRCDGPPTSFLPAGGGHSLAPFRHVRTRGGAAHP